MCCTSHATDCSKLKCIEAFEDNRVLCPGGGCSVRALSLPPRVRECNPGERLRGRRTALNGDAPQSSWCKREPLWRECEGGGFPSNRIVLFSDLPRRANAVSLSPSLSLNSRSVSPEFVPTDGSRSTVFSGAPTSLFLIRGIEIFRFAIYEAFSGVFASVRYLRRLRWKMNLDLLFLNLLSCG